MSDQADALALRLARLSERQLEVLRLVGQHHSSKEIAVMLGISSHTVDQRVGWANRALGVDSRWEAARLFSEANVNGSYQRLIHQSPHLDPDGYSSETNEAVSFQIRHADRAKGDGDFGLHTELSPGKLRSSLVWPRVGSAMSVARLAQWARSRALCILTVALGTAACTSIYLIGLKGIARLIRL